MSCFLLGFIESMMPKCGRVYQKANHHLPFFGRDGIMKVSAKHENKESVLYRTRT